MTAPAVAPRKTRRTPVAYRVKTSNGTLVLCWSHVDLFRLVSSSPVKFTGETFDVKLCDHCHPELM